MTTQTQSSRGPARLRPSRRLIGQALTLSLVMTTVTVATGTAAAASPPHSGTTTFGPNVTIFDPSMPVGQIQAALDATHTAQVSDEMGTKRYTYWFKPGTYGTAERPLQIKVGYYTEIAGLGASPAEVTINGKIAVYNRCLNDGERAIASPSTTSGARCPTCR